MAQQVINIGTSPNDGTGDQLRTAFDKCNDNFTELYAGGLGDLQQVTDIGATTTNPITTANLTINEGGGGDPCINTNQSLTDGSIISSHFDTDSNFGISVRFPASITGNRTIDYPNSTGTIATQEWVIANPSGGAVDSVNGQTGVVVLDATDVDALQRDGSNANSDIDIDTFSFNAKSLHAKGTAGAGHLGLKHQSSNATASGSETSLFAGSDGELYYKNDGNAVEQVASETFVNTGLALKSNLSTTPRILANDESGITSTGTETVCATVQIDNLGTNWAMDLWLDMTKNGTASGMQSKIYLNNTPNLSGTPTQLAVSSSDINTRRNVPLSRKVSYKGGIFKSTNSATNIQSDFVSNNVAKSETTIDLNTAQARYLVFTVQRTGAAGDTVTALRHQVIFYPNV